MIIFTFISWFQYSFVFDLIAILMMSARTDTLGLLKIILSWKNVNDVIISIYEVISKTSLYDSNYIVDMVMKPKFGNTSISMTEISKISVFKIFSEKNMWSWFKFNNLRFILSMAFILDSSMEKGLQLNVRKFWGLIPVLEDITEENLGGGGYFCQTLS